MRKAFPLGNVKHRDTQVPVFIEKDGDGFYVVECPLFQGCYSQGKTVDEALRNIREVIHLIVEEKKKRDILRTYHPKELSLHTITLSPWPVYLSFRAGRLSKHRLVSSPLPRGEGYYL
jgi:predicted RNase H-like HicB family nuclease